MAVGFIWLKPIKGVKQLYCSNESKNQNLLIFKVMPDFTNHCVESASRMHATGKIIMFPVLLTDKHQTTVRSFVT